MTDQTPIPEVPSSPEPQGATPPAPELGESGKRALEAERKARREAEQNAKALQARVTELEAAEVRREVAIEKGLTPAQAKRLVGATREELEADADELLEVLAPPRGSTPPEGKPREALRGGTDPTVGIEPDAGQVADRIISRGF